MRIELYKKTKIYISYVLFIMTFIGMGGSIDATGHELSFFESFILAIIVCTINGIMWSDWMYNYLNEEGVKVNHIVYQKIGIFVTVLFVVIIGASTYSGHTQKQGINLIGALAIIVILYLLIIKSTERVT